MSLTLSAYPEVCYVGAGKYITIIVNIARWLKTSMVGEKQGKFKWYGGIIKLIKILQLWAKICNVLHLL